MTDRDRFDRSGQRRPWDRQRYETDFDDGRYQTGGYSNNMYRRDEREDRDYDRGRSHSRLGGSGEEDFERYYQGSYQGASRGGYDDHGERARSYGGYGSERGPQYYGGSYGQYSSNTSGERGPQYGGSYGSGPQHGGGYGSGGYGGGSFRERDWGRSEHDWSRSDNDRDMWSRQRGGYGSRFEAGMRDFGERSGYSYGGPRDTGSYDYSQPGDERSRGQSQRSSGQRTPYFGTTSSQRRQHWGHGPKGYKRSDERIREDVCDALMMHPDIDASELEIRVSDGEVTLSGTVQDRSDKFLAEQLSEGIAGVRDVTNSIRVQREHDRESGQTTGQTSSEASQRGARSGSQASSNVSQGGSSSQQTGSSNSSRA